MRYILPTNEYKSSGGQPAHLNADGRPACGAPLPDAYASGDWLYSWLLCPECERIRASGMVQAGLFAEVQP